MPNGLHEAALTGEALTHITHLEDLPLFGSSAADMVVQVLSSLENTLKGNTTGSFTPSIKMDGSPSVLASTNFHGDRFVATKSFFAKSRKIARTAADVESLYGHAPSLASKMLKLLNSLDMIDIPKDDIWQGDFLFENEDITLTEIDGEQYTTFHPNTIVYAVPAADPMAKRINRATIGVAWHTVYRGEDFDSLKISFDASIDRVQETPTVLQMDSRLPSIAGKVTLTQEETEYVASSITSIKGQLLELASFLDFIAEDKPLQTYLTTFHNTLVKSGVDEYPADYSSQLTAWVTAAFEKQAASKKRAVTKQAYIAKGEEQVALIAAHGDDIESLLMTQKQIMELKELFIQKLRHLAPMQSFVQHLDKGYVSTGGEGFTASDINGNITKLVSRLEFSRNNFSKDVVKGWMSDRRVQEATPVQAIVQLATGSLGLRQQPTQSPTSSIQKLYDPKNDRWGAMNKMATVLDAKGFEVEPFEKKTTPALRVNDQLQLLFKDVKGMRRSATNKNSVERAHLTELQKEIKRAKEESLLDEITLVIGGQTIPHVARCANVPKVPKADFVLVNSKNKPLFWISHKAGKTSRSFQQYGGLGREKDHPEVQAFIDKIFDIYSDHQDPEVATIPKTAWIYRPIKDKQLALRALYGYNYGSGKFERNNCNAILQGHMQLQEVEDGVYELKCAHMLFNGELPAENDAYCPVLQMSQRDQFITKTSRGDIIGGRLMILAKGQARSRKPI
jgi:hypothetical protein